MTKSHEDSPNFLFYTIYSIGAIGFSMCNQNRFDDQKDSDFFINQNINKYNINIHIEGYR